MPSLFVNRAYKQAKSDCNLLFMSIPFFSFVFVASTYSDSSLRNTLKNFCSKVEFCMQIKILLELSKGQWVLWCCLTAACANNSYLSLARTSDIFLQQSGNGLPEKEICMSELFLGECLTMTRSKEVQPGVLDEMRNYTVMDVTFSKFCDGEWKRFSLHFIFTSLSPLILLKTHKPFNQ